MRRNCTCSILAERLPSSSIVMLPIYFFWLTIPFKATRDHDKNCSDTTKLDSAGRWETVSFVFFSNIKDKKEIQIIWQITLIIIDSAVSIILRSLIPRWQFFAYTNLSVNSKPYSKLLQDIIRGFDGIESWKNYKIFVTLSIKLKQQNSNKVFFGYRYKQLVKQLPQGSRHQRVCTRSEYFSQDIYLIFNIKFENSTSTVFSRFIVFDLNNSQKREREWNRGFVFKSLILFFSHDNWKVFPAFCRFWRVFFWLSPSRIFDFQDLFFSEVYQFFLFLF